ncbi:unnamed protein product [Calypogeia fissa]
MWQVRHSGSESSIEGFASFSRVFVDVFLTTTEDVDLGGNPALGARDRFIPYESGGGDDENEDERKVGRIKARTLVEMDWCMDLP